jgi:hypothetical protein
MLLQLRDYIKLKKLVSIEQISRDFKVDSSALRPMLSIWINKGFIVRQVDDSKCKVRCGSCNVKVVDYYSWV